MALSPAPLGHLASPVPEALLDHRDPPGNLVHLAPLARREPPGKMVWQGSLDRPGQPVLRDHLAPLDLPVPRGLMAQTERRERMAIEASRAPTDSRASKAQPVSMARTAR